MHRKNKIIVIFCFFSLLWLMGILYNENHYSSSILDSQESNKQIEHEENSLEQIIPKTSVEATNVCITEVVADGGGSTYEWIEIYNPTSSPVDLTGWDIYDIGGGNVEVDIGAHVSTIAPGEVITFGDDNAPTDYNDSVTFTDSGEELALRNGTGHYQDVVLYGSVGTSYLNTWYWKSGNSAPAPDDPSESIQRINITIGGELEDNNNESDWVLTTNPTPGYLPQYNPGAAGSILITEVMVDSSDYMEYDGEYIELYNPGDASIDISDWTIQYDNLGSTQATIPSSTTIPAKTYFLITDNDTYASIEYGFTGLNHTESLSLSASSPKDLCLTDPYSTIIDRFAYRMGSADFVDTVDPLSWQDEGVYIGSEGKSLSRLYDPDNNDAYLDNNVSEDWRYNTIPNPGKHSNNSIFLSKPLMGNGTVTAFSSPDNSFNAITHLMDVAQSNIDICVYQFTSSYLLDHLTSAMDRGIQVRAIFEDSYPGASVHTTDDPTAHEVVYVAKTIYEHPNGTIRWEGYAGGRYTHAKYMIIDNNTVAIGTENYKATGIPKDPSYGNRGWGIAINNTELAGIYLDVFNLDWSVADPYDPGYVVAPLQNTDVFYGAYSPISGYRTYNDVNATFQTVVGPDETIDVIVDLIDSAKTKIYGEIFYMYPTWTGYPGGQNNNPFLKALIDAAQRGVDIKIILDSTFYNLDDENDNDEAAQVMKAHGIEVKYSNNSGGIEKFHVKGFIVDEEAVMISSLNWNENSATNNREIGIIVNSSEVAEYYVELFLRDWDKQASTEVPEYKEPGIIPTYTWLQWLPLISIVYMGILGTGYSIRHQKEKSEIKNRKIQDRALEKRKKLTEPTPEAQQEIPIDINAARENLNYFYGDAVKMSHLNYDGTPFDNVIPSQFVMNFIEYNHDMIKFGEPIRPIPQVLILKYHPEKYVAIEGTMQLHLRLMDENIKLKISQLETNLNLKDLELRKYQDQLKTLEDKLDILESTTPVEEGRRGKKVKISGELKRKEAMIKKMKEKMKVVEEEKTMLERDLNMLTGGEMTPLSDLINELQMKIKKQSILIKKLEETNKEEPKYGHL